MPEQSPSITQQAQQAPAPEGFLPSPQESLLVNALSSAANAIFITDRGGRIVWANRSFQCLCGYSIQEVLGNNPSMMKSGMQSEAFYAELWQTVLAGNVWRGVVVDRRKDGTLYTVDETITPLTDEHGAVTHFIAIQQDMAPRTEEQERDHYLAYHDGLTGLPNRASFLDQQRQAISAARSAHHGVALLFLDLDRFKPVNDTFGHDVGDRLLFTVAERLAGAVRKSDTVARLGGDEFGILLPKIDDPPAAFALARKLADTISRPFVIGGQRIEIGASIGIAIFPDDADEPGELMRKADQAMYRAKHGGGSGCRHSGGDIP